MEKFHQQRKENGLAENGHSSRGVMRYSSYQPSVKASFSWIDTRVFYVRINNFDDSTPEYLTLNLVPLNRDTLLEVNGVRTSIYSDGASALLRRDRLDKKSEEVTFVGTDNIRMTGSINFEVFDKDVLILSGALKFCQCNGFIGKSNNHSPQSNLNCQLDVFAGAGFLKGKLYMGLESNSPAFEVYVAGSFLSHPFILTKTVQISSRKKQLRKGTLESIPEYEASESQKDASSLLALQAADYPNCKLENEDYNLHLYSGIKNLEVEGGELSWFNAGVRVGVGIGLSICLGIGIGVGVLVKTYQGTTRTFRRRLL